MLSAAEAANFRRTLTESERVVIQPDPNRTKTQFSDEALSLCHTVLCWLLMCGVTSRDMFVQAWLHKPQTSMKRKEKRKLFYFFYRGVTKSYQSEPKHNFKILVWTRLWCLQLLLGTETKVLRFIFDVLKSFCFICIRRLSSRVSSFGLKVKNSL